MDTTANRPIRRYTMPQKHDLIWNLLTFAVLLSTIFLVGLFILVYVFPGSSFNPFPPSTAAALIPAAGETSQSPAASTVEPTSTVEVVLQPSDEPTQIPTQEPTQTALPTMEVTPLPLIPTDTAEVEIGLYPFDLRNDPAYVASTIFHPDDGCAWMGIGGQVFDRQGAPLMGVSILLSGRLHGKAVSMLSLTGTARQYGEAGYEFWLGDQALDTDEVLWIQLLDQAQLTISPKVPVTTHSDCQKNLTIITFRQVK